MKQLLKQVLLLKDANAPFLPAKLVSLYLFPIKADLYNSGDPGFVLMKPQRKPVFFELAQSSLVFPNLNENSM